MNETKKIELSGYVAVKLNYDWSQDVKTLPGALVKAWSLLLESSNAVMPPIFYTSPGIPEESSNLLFKPRVLRHLQTSDTFRIPSQDA